MALDHRKSPRGSRPHGLRRPTAPLRRGVDLGASLPESAGEGKFDIRRSRMHPGTAMTTAPTRVPSASRIRLAGAFALTIMVVIFILPL